MIDPLGFGLENFDPVGQLARASTRCTRRSTRRAICPTAPSSTASPSCASALVEASRSLRERAHREAAHLRARPRRRVLRHAGGAEDRAGQPPPADYQLSTHHPGITKSLPFQQQESRIMIITKMALPRRTFLRGMGATLALPLLDAMVPALSAMQTRPRKPVPGSGSIYAPNGTYLPELPPDGRRDGTSSSRRC